MTNVSDSLSLAESVSLSVGDPNMVAQSSAIVDGTILTLHSAVDPITFTNDGRTTKLIAYNSSGATRTFDAVTAQLVQGDLAVDDRSYSIDDGDYVYIGAFDSTVYSDSAIVTLQNFNSASGLVFMCITG